MMRASLASLPSGSALCAVHRRVPVRRRLLTLLLAVVLYGASCAVLWHAGHESAVAASAFSPRRSGLEPPGGPRPIEGLPGRDVSRTDQGGMGYTDAYGRVLEDVPPPEKKPRKRPGPGAYGGYGREAEPVRPLPDVQESRPAWNFN